MPGPARPAGLEGEAGESGSGGVGGARPGPAPAPPRPSPLPPRRLRPGGRHAGSLPAWEHGRSRGGQQRGAGSAGAALCALQPRRRAPSRAAAPGRAARPRPGAGSAAGPRVRVPHAAAGRHHRPQLLAGLGGRQHGPLQLHLQAAPAAQLPGAAFLPALPRQERSLRGRRLPAPRRPGPAAPAAVSAAGAGRAGPGGDAALRGCGPGEGLRGTGRVHGEPRRERRWFLRGAAVEDGALGPPPARGGELRDAWRGGGRRVAVCAGGCGGSGEGVLLLEGSGSTSASAEDVAFQQPVTVTGGVSRAGLAAG